MKSKKKVILFSTISALVLLIPVGIILTFNKPTALNKYIANKVYNEPANEKFADDNFYNCVVDSYNREFKKSVPYTRRLTGVELALISSVICETNVNSIEGIETLVNLEELTLKSNNLTSIDLYSNKLLTGLNIVNSKITELDLSENKNLSYLTLKHNYNLENVIIPEKTNITSNTPINNIIYGEDKSISVNSEYEFYPNKSIRVNNNVTGNELIDNLNLENLNAKVLNGNTEVTTENVTDGNILKIYNQEELIQTLNIEIFINGYFKDKNLYKAIIDEYNQANDANLTTNDLLNDSQLATITKLESNYEIENLTGIEKLTSLEKIILTEAEVNEKTINLNNLENLRKLWLENTALSSDKINELRSELNLNSLYIYNLDNEEIDFSLFTNLTELGYTGIMKEIDLTNLASLEKIKIKGCFNLTNIDISTLSNLTELVVNDNKRLETLDVTNNTNLNVLDIKNNNLSSIDLSNNSKLTTIALTGNKFNDSINLLVGEQTTLLSEKVKLPNNITPTYTLGSGYSLSYDETEHKVTAINTGTTVIREVLNKGDDSFIEINIGVYDLTSDLFEIDYSKNEIYTGTSNPAEIMKNIKTTTGKIVFDNDKIILKNGKNIIREMDLVGYYCYTYDLSQDVIIANKKFDSRIITLLNTTLDNGENKITIKHDNEVIKEYDIYIADLGNLYISKGDIVIAISSNFIPLENVIKISYDGFVENINLPEGLTYKVFTDEDIEATSEDTIKDGYKVVIYKDDEAIYTYDVVDAILKVENNIIGEIEYVMNIDPGTAIAEVLETVYTTGNFTIKDKDGNDVNLGGIAKTGDEIIIDILGYEKTIKIKAKGDATGDGHVNVNDIVKVVNVIEKVIQGVELGEFEQYACDITGDGFINVNDIVKEVALLEEVLSN